MNLNFSGFVNSFKLLTKPSLCLPHATVSQFHELPLPLEKAFEGQGQRVQIKAVVLDKDDCFAYPETNLVHPPYVVSLHVFCSVQASTNGPSVVNVGSSASTVS
jgi:phosphatidylglycerophosphatase GEP4